MKRLLLFCACVSTCLATLGACNAEAPAPVEPEPVAEPEPEPVAKAQPEVEAIAEASPPVLAATPSSDAADTLAGSGATYFNTSTMALYPEVAYPLGIVMILGLGISNPGYSFERKAE